MKKSVVVLLVSINIAALVFGQDKHVPGKSNSVRLIVRTQNGLVQGVQEQSGVVSFKGIPFALPPVGNLRWREPQPMHTWPGVRSADKFGPRAIQPPIFSDMMFRSDGMSEDCLYLNVWTPSGAKNKLPVLVYFYGGGFIAGDGSEFRYDGENMAAQGIIAITVNYRLGLFGFLAHPALSKESLHHSSGNYGLLDQAMALKWVKQNIKAFGGDPDKITIAGESAGSFSVSAQMASPLSKNLIRAAIGESGSLLGGGRVATLSEAEKKGSDFFKRIGGSLPDLRKLKADTLLSYAMKAGSFSFPVCIDGYFFPKSPLAIYASGSQARIPLLAGWNSEEGSYRNVLGNDKPNIENFIKDVRKLYGERAESIIKVYQPSSDSDVTTVAAALASDRSIAYSTWKWTDLHAKTSGKPVYRYFFSRPRPGANSANRYDHGAAHSAEIEYAMGNLATNKVYSWDEEDYAVSKTMQSYFVHFVKSLNPNGPGLPKWPPLVRDSIAPVMHIDVHTGLQPETHRDRYELLDMYMHN